MLMGKDVMTGFLRAVSMTIAPFDRSRGQSRTPGVPPPRRPRPCRRPALKALWDAASPPLPPPQAGEVGWEFILVYLKMGGRGMMASSSSIRRLYSGSRWRHNPPAGLG